MSDSHEQHMTLLQAILLELKCMNEAMRATAASFEPVRHEGEAVAPVVFNPWLAVIALSGELVGELRALRQENSAHAADVVRLCGRLEHTLKRWDRDGFPASTIPD